MLLQIDNNFTFICLKVSYLGAFHLKYLERNKSDITWILTSILLILKWYQNVFTWEKFSGKCIAPLDRIPRPGQGKGQGQGQGQGP